MYKNALYATHFRLQLSIGMRIRSYSSAADACAPLAQKFTVNGDRLWFVLCWRSGIPHTC